MKKIIPCLFAMMLSAQAHPGHGDGLHFHSENGANISLFALTAVLILCTFTTVKLIIKTRKNEV